MSFPDPLPLELGGDSPRGFAFEAAMLDACPPWLRRTRGAALMGAFGAVLDTLSQRAAEGVRLRFPGFDVDALPMHGRERRIQRGPLETDERYAARLWGWRQAHRGRGGPYALLEQLRAYFADSPRQIDVVYHSGTRRSLVTGRPTDLSFRSLPWHTLVIPSDGVTLEGGAVSQINDLSGNGHHFVQATASARPTIITGPHGKSEILFDGVDDFLRHGADVTFPTNYVVWVVFRFLTLPSAAPPGTTTRYVWTMTDGGSVTEYLSASPSNRIAGSMGGAITITTPTIDNAIRAVTTVASAYPSGELRTGNTLLDTLGPGTSNAPIVGRMAVGTADAGVIDRYANIAVAAWGVLDADVLGADLEATLAELQAYSEQTWLAPGPALETTNTITRDAITWDADGTALWAQAWLFHHLDADPGVLSAEELEDYKAIPREWNAGHMLPIHVWLIWPGARGAK